MMWTIILLDYQESVVLESNANAGFDIWTASVFLYQIKDIKAFMLYIALAVHSKLPFTAFFIYNTLFANPNTTLQSFNH